MKTTRPHGRSVLIGVLIPSFGLWLGWQANNFFAQDICLDRGGAWDEDMRSCRFSASPSANLSAD